MNDQTVELLYQSLETEIGGAQIYEHAIRCAQNEDLRKEWTGYLEETRNHERILRDVFRKLKLDTERETPGRRIVRHQGKSLVQAIVMGLRDGTPQAAEIVASECVVLAETKDLQNWELLGRLAKSMKGDSARVLAEAYEQVGDEEAEHLYHTMGWSRELWLASLGLPAVLPPPEEKRDVKSATEAAQAKEDRAKFTGGKP